MKVIKNVAGVFNNVDTLLALSISHGSLDSGKNKMVNEEALINCCPLRCSGFLQLLTLSSVCLRFVHCYYKRYDTKLKYKRKF